MPSAEENAATVRRGYGFFNTGDMDGLQQLFAEDAVWHVGGRNPLSGEKRGRDAVFGYFGTLAELTNGTFRAELHDVIASDEHVVGLHTATGERQGRRLSEHEALVFHLRDGKVVEAWEHYEDSRAVDDFLGA
jgi:uncharacterized protein